jgi:adenine-specific DNA-methyltransferase
VAPHVGDTITLGGAGSAYIVIKYLGSKRRLVHVLGDIAETTSAKTAVDLFTGTTRVAQTFRQRACATTAVDTNRYCEAFARTYLTVAPTATKLRAIDNALVDIAGAPDIDGYITQVFCREARFFHPDNGRRIDGMRAAIAERYARTWLEPVLLTALIEAADRVDSTAGLQMAYLKAWAPRALRPIALRRPVIGSGPVGRAVRTDALAGAKQLGPFDLAYLDPPYNQHRYDANYHVWETLAANDQPEYYGVACKRTDLREAKSAFNDKREMPGALSAVIEAVDARVVVLSYNNEAWLTLEDLVEMCSTRGEVTVLTFDSKRYIGAQIGIHNPAGAKVGTVGTLRNLEYVLVTGDLRAAERRRIAGLGAA